MFVLFIYQTSLSGYCFSVPKYQNWNISPNVHLQPQQSKAAIVVKLHLVKLLKNIAVINCIFKQILDYIKVVWKKISNICVILITALTLFQNCVGSRMEAVFILSCWSQIKNAFWYFYFSRWKELKRSKSDSTRRRWITKANKKYTNIGMNFVEIGLSNLVELPEFN